jgi:hypothetical protein
MQQSQQVGYKTQFVIQTPAIYSQDAMSLINSIAKLGVHWQWVLVTTSSFYPFRSWFPFFALASLAARCSPSRWASKKSCRVRKLL